MFFLCTCGRLAAFFRKRNIRTVRLAKDDSVIKKYRRKKMKLNDEIKGYWEGEADIYSRAIWKELTGPQCEEWKKIILKYAPKKEPMEILDAGCGPGFFPVILGREGHRVTGIDITENMIARAKENVERYGQHAVLKTMDCQELQFPDNTFDMVISRNITWTLDDPQKAYLEWKRVLKPGGRMLVFDGCWYLHLYDEKLKRQFEENEKRILKKYGRKIHTHADPEKGDELSRQFFMSDKQRPVWDLEYLIEAGFSVVFAEPDISDKVWDEMEKDINGLTPVFLVGAEK